MRKKRNRCRDAFRLAGKVAFFAWLVVGVAVESVEGAPGVLVEFFHEAGCHQCEEVRLLLRRVLLERHGSAVVWVEREIGVESNFLALVAYQEQAGTIKEGPATVVVNGREMFVGGMAVVTATCEAVERALAGPEEGAGRAAIPATSTMAGQQALEQRWAKMTWGSVILAGLVDSVNPCAVGTIVFLVSALGAARVRGRRWLVAGATYVAAVFLTYLGLGFGLFRLVRLWWGIYWLRLVFSTAMIIMLLTLAWLSFRDAWQFARSGQPSAVTVRLPESVTRMLHGVIRRSVWQQWGVPVALGLGVMVTLVEAGCTGQVYFPTLVFLVKTNASIGRALAYLLVYNALFVLPLVAILALSFLGMHIRALVEWSRRNVVWSKVLMGLFFLGLTALYIR